MQQVIVIGGGETFGSRNEYLKFLRKMTWAPKKLNDNKRGWKANLQKELGHAYHVINVSMPSPLNAQYDEWALMFDKVVPHLQENPIYIGHSLGGSFLVKYFNENDKKLPVAKATFLVSAPYVEKTFYAKGVETFGVRPVLTRFRRVAGQVYILHSTDDTIVPFADAEEYATRLPGSILSMFDNQGHFISNERIGRLTKLIRKL